MYAVLPAYAVQPLSGKSTVFSVQVVHVCYLLRQFSHWDVLIPLAQCKLYAVLQVFLEVYSYPWLSTSCACCATCLCSTDTKQFSSQLAQLLSIDRQMKPRVCHAEQFLVFIFKLMGIHQLIYSPQFCYSAGFNQSIHPYFRSPDFRSLFPIFAAARTPMAVSNIWTATRGSNYTSVWEEPKVKAVDFFTRTKMFKLFQPISSLCQCHQI